MMNVVAIVLVVTSLAAAGVWSPSSSTASLHHQAGDNVIVKDGHRVVVVEYDKDGRPNTKVSISSDTPASGSKEEEEQKSGGGDHHPGLAAKELICDAYGKCKHVISSTLGKARDEAAAKVDDTKEFVSHKAHDAKERAKETFEAAKDEAREAKESASQKAQDAKEALKEDAKSMAGEAERSVSEALEKGRVAKETAKGRLTAWALKAKETMGRMLLVSPTALAGLLNLAGFVTAFGMCTWVTFISSYVLAKTLPRQQFAQVQSKIYPVYFRAMIYSIGAALLGHLSSQRKRLFSSRPEMLQGYNLLAALLMVSFNMLYLEPQATKVMFERMKLEKEEGRGRDLFGGESPASTTTATAATATAPAPAGGGAADAAAEEAALRARVVKLNARLKSLNSYSSLVNILTLMALTWHLVYLNQRLSQTC